MRKFKFKIYDLCALFKEMHIDTLRNTGARQNEFGKGWFIL